MCSSYYVTVAQQILLMSPGALKNWLLYTGYITAVIAGLIIASFELASVQLSPLNLSNYNSYTCTTQNPSSGRVFRVLTLSAFQARELADEICSYGATYNLGAVEISWQSRDYLTPQNIVEGDFDLFWNRLHLVQGMVPNLLNFYTQILDTPRYSLHWMTLDDNPFPDAVYFQDKVVGLLMHSESQSFFQQPSAWLHKHDINLKDSQIRYYPSLDALLHAFATGEVDLISALPTMTSDLDIGPVASLLINNDMESGTWFLKQSWSESKLGCDLLNTLQNSTPTLFHGEGFSGFEERLSCAWN